jgi:DNA-binding CsgD family transcriptional regulator
MTMVTDPRDVVTPRQRELLALYASGYTLEEIAAQKFLSTSSVRQTLRVAKERVGAKSLTHLAVLCVEAGVIYSNGTGFKPLQVDGVVSE